MLKKKTFLARAFRTRAIDLWNNLDCAIKLISSKSMFKSAVLKQLDCLYNYIIDYLDTFNVL